ncbi:Signal transduction histidine kinase, LytS [Tenacibaculum litopenaei]|uniref:sensor histidine kinase n=1 Tax=Tenacibaculum litopenaei TaxID=396016 RepID=UPI0038960BC7
MNSKLNRSDIYLLLAYFLISFSIQSYKYAQRNAYLREYLIDFPVEALTLTTSIAIFVFWLIPRMVEEKKYLRYTIVGLVVMISITSIDYTIGFWTGGNDWSKFPLGLEFVRLMIDKSAEEMAFPFALLLTKKFYEGQNNLLKIEKQQKENELKLLRSQIDPHFLFNNLNTLDSLIDSDPEKAKEYINKLSLIYRYLIQTKDSEVMELQEEVNLARNYIFLIQTRFANDYQFDLALPELADDLFLPTGALQTLLENVVKHNKPQHQPIKTQLSYSANSITITNTRSAIQTPEISFGTGLENLKTRYRHFTDIPVRIRSSQDEFSVSIPIIKLTS